jgi:hypothetical protein
MTSVRDQALELHNLGIQVVPALSPRTHRNFKRPSIPWQQYQDALVSREQVEAWFPPDYAGNLGIICGRASGNLFAIDIDNEEGERWWQTVCEVHNHGIPIEAPEVRTPRGGRHLFFRAPPGWTPPTLKGPGVDIRGQGGFLMGPGSLGLHDRRYEWIRSFLECEAPVAIEGLRLAIDALGRALQQAPAAVNQSSTPAPALPRVSGNGAGNGHATPSGVQNGGIVLGGELHNLGKVVDGREHHLRNILAAAHAEHVRANGCSPTPQELAEEVWGVVQHKFELARPGADGRPYDYRRCLEGAAQLIRRADQGKARGLGLNEILSAAPAAVPKLGTPAPAPAPASPPKKDFGWVTRGNAAVVLDAHWLIKKVLPADGIGVIYGRPGSGKTFSCLDLALHIALGRPWRGMKVEKKAVSYVSPEAGRLGANRVIGWCLHHKAEWPETFRLSPAGINLRSSAEDALALIADIKAAQPDCGLVVIDTLNRAMAGGDENSSEDMGAFVGMCDAVAKALGCLVLIVHHSGKDAAKGSRGHSSLLGAVGVELEVLREQGLPGTIKNTKQRDGEDGAEYGFNLEKVVLGVDRDNEEVSTAVAVEAGADEARVAHAAEPSGAIQKHVAKAFEQYAADNGVLNPTGTGFPEPGAVRCVKSAEFMQYASEKMVGPRPEFQCKRAVEKLVEKGYFVVNGGLIWRPR